MVEKELKPKRKYQKHKTEKKIGLKFFPNKRLKGHNSAETGADNLTVKTYPVYIQITHRQQTLLVRSEYFTNHYEHVTEFDFLHLSDIFKQLIEGETEKILTCLPKMPHFQETDQDKFSLATLFKEYAEKYRTGLYYRLEKTLMYVVYFSQFLEKQELTDWITAGDFLTKADAERPRFKEMAHQRQVYQPIRTDNTPRAIEILAYYGLFKHRYNVECQEMFTSLTWHSLYLFEMVRYFNPKLPQSEKQYTLFELENGLLENSLINELKADIEPIRGFLNDLHLLMR